MIYYFCDDGGQAIIGGEKVDLEYSIKGKDYEKLIETCFLLASRFSLMFTDRDAHMEKEPPPCQIDVSEIYETRFYKCTEESKKFMLSLEQDLLEWRGIYQDLCFYRADGTVLFWSQTHEGVCALKSGENEDVSAIVKALGWHTYDPKIEERNSFIPSYFYDKSQICEIKDERQKFIYSYYEEANLPDFCKPPFDFEKFIMACSRFCTHFSATFSSASQIPQNEPAPYRTEIVGTHLSEGVYFEKRFYKLTEETIGFILPVAKKHFQQKYDITSPDTIAFYRADGTEFFSINSFAPILSILPAEDMSEFLSHRWIKQK